MKLIVLVISCALSPLFSISQNYDFAWGDDKDQLIEAFVPVDSNSFFVMQNAGGLGIFKYSYSKETGVLQTTKTDFKHMETYKLMYGDYLIKDEKLYEIVETHEGSKKDGKPKFYTLALQERNSNTFEVKDEPVVLLQSQATDKWCYHHAYYENENQFLIVRMFNTKSGYSVDAGLNFLVFDKTDLSLTYSQSIELTEKEQYGILNRIKFNDKNEVFVSSLVAESPLPSNTSTLRLEKNIYTIDASGIKKAIEAPDNQQVLTTAFSETQDFQYSISVDNIDGTIFLNTSNFDFKNISNKTLNCRDLMSSVNSIASQEFDKNLGKYNTINFKIQSSEFISLDDNSELGTISIDFYAGNLMNKAISASLMYKINPDGTIAWFKNLDFSKIATFWEDSKNDIHLFANDVSKFYDKDGKFIDSDPVKVTPNSRYKPVEVILDSKSGEITSRSVITKGFEDGEVFQSFRTFRINDSLIVTPKWKQSGTSQFTRSPRQMAITGVMNIEK
ncbi:MAG: hypothetical protein ACJA1C_000893 [Crocinitomicaceae bacterium]|jgi:hypothetical protein